MTSAAAAKSDLETERPALSRETAPTPRVEATAGTSEPDARS